MELMEFRPDSDPSVLRIWALFFFIFLNLSPRARTTLPLWPESLTKHQSYISKLESAGGWGRRGIAPLPGGTLSLSSHGAEHGRETDFQQKDQGFRPCGVEE